MNRYQSKPSEVEAIQWIGDNFDEIEEFGAIVKLKDGELKLLAGKYGAQGSVPVPLFHWIVRKPDDTTDHWPVDDDYFAEKYFPIKEGK